MNSRIHLSFSKHNFTQLSFFWLCSLHKLFLITVQFCSIGRQLAIVTIPPGRLGNACCVGEFPGVPFVTRLTLQSYMKNDEKSCDRNIVSAQNPSVYEQRSSDEKWKITHSVAEIPNFSGIIPERWHQEHNADYAFYPGRRTGEKQADFITH